MNSRDVHFPCPARSVKAAERRAPARTTVGFRTRLLNRHQLEGWKQSDAERSHSKGFAGPETHAIVAKRLECERSASHSRCPAVLQLKCDAERSHSKRFATIASVS